MKVILFYADTKTSLWICGSSQLMGPESRPPYHDLPQLLIMPRKPEWLCYLSPILVLHLQHSCTWCEHVQTESNLHTSHCATQRSWRCLKPSARNSSEGAPTSARNWYLSTSIQGLLLQKTTLSSRVMVSKALAPSQLHWFLHSCPLYHPQWGTCCPRNSSHWPFPVPTWLVMIAMNPLPMYVASVHLPTNIQALYTTTWWVISHSCPSMVACASLYCIITRLTLYWQCQLEV